MFKNISTNRVACHTDDVTLQFRFRGNLDTNYDGFLADAAEAVVQLKANYWRGTKAGNSAHANRTRQIVINALDILFHDGR